MLKVNEKLANVNEAYPQDQSDAAQKLISQILEGITKWKSKKQNMRMLRDASVQALKNPMPIEEGGSLAALFDNLADFPEFNRTVGSTAIRTLLSQLLKFELEVNRRHDVREGYRAPENWEVDNKGNCKLVDLENTPAEHLILEDIPRDWAGEVVEMIKGGMEVLYLFWFQNETELAWKQIQDDDGNWIDICDRHQALQLQEADDAAYRKRAKKEAQQRTKEAVKSAFVF